MPEELRHFCKKGLTTARCSGAPGGYDRPMGAVTRRKVLARVSGLVVSIVLSAWLTERIRAVGGHAARGEPMVEHFEVEHSDAEWHKLLSPEQYAVLRREATEAPGSSPLEHEHRDGRYSCAGCANGLFTSNTKFDSGSGWPSFYAPLPHAVATRSDRSLGDTRTEVHCARCGGHLGHVFDDGPAPTGKRYCMNGVALRFRPDAWRL
jgi:peptide-methionine (R)-S-oxide reductase